MEILGKDGHYYIDGGGRTLFHAMAGIIFRLKHSPLRVIIGLEGLPPYLTFNFGLGLKIGKTKGK